jgi:hypothetical protein
LNFRGEQATEGQSYSQKWGTLPICLLICWGRKFTKAPSTYHWKNYTCSLHESPKQEWSLHLILNCALLRTAIERQLNHVHDEMLYFSISSSLVATASWTWDCFLDLRLFVDWIGRLTSVFRSSEFCILSCNWAICHYFDRFWVYEFRGHRWLINEVLSSSTTLQRNFSYRRPIQIL